MIEWAIIGVFVLVTALWIGFDYRRTKVKLCQPMVPAVDEKKDETKVFQRQAVVKEAESKVIRKAEEIERIKHETEIIDLVQVSPPAEEGAHSSNPATDTALFKIIAHKVDEVKKLRDEKLSEGGLAR